MNATLAQLSVVQVNIMIENEKDPTKKYWLKQARMHFRSARTHNEKGNEILRRLATYKPGEKVTAGIQN